MEADHFLQKNDVCIKRAQAVTQLMQHHAPIKMGKTFVNVIGRDMQRIEHMVNVSLSRKIDMHAPCQYPFPVRWRNRIFSLY
jgi:hypothetical protein